MNNVKARLQDAGIKEVCKSMVGEMVVFYRTKKENKTLPKAKIRSSADAAAYFREIPGWKDTLEYKESFYILALNRSNYVEGWVKLSEGGISGCVVDRRIIFQHLLEFNASSFIMAHNHPSGNQNPSDADIGITKKIYSAGKIMDIDLLDHIIITEQNSDGKSYFSFADNSILS